MKISVIIPMYNADKYIQECVDSIMKQSLKDIEVICVDDGSKDDTVLVVKKLQKIYSNIVLISQENCGAGAARNYGLSLAQGEYIAFIDADDFYKDSDTLEVMYNKAKSNAALICGGNFCNFHNGVFSYEGLRKGLLMKEEGWLYKEKFPTCVGYVRFLYSREFLIENEILFPNYLRGQDLSFFVKALAKAGKVYIFPKTTYWYRKEHKQVKYDKKRAIDYAKAIRDSLYIAKTEGMEEILAMLLEEIWGEPSALMYSFEKESEEMKNIISDINQILEICGQRKLLEGKEILAYLESVKNEEKKFRKELKKYFKVLIFGAGTLGKKVLTFLRNNNIEPEAFVVSSVEQNPKEIEGVGVKCIDDYKTVQEDCLILISVFPFLQDEIQQLLIEKGFQHYYLIDLEKFCLFQSEITH